MPAEPAPKLDRLPLPTELTDSQRSAVDTIATGPRGALIACFIPLVRTPELLTRLQLVGEYLRFRSGLPALLRELVILTVARSWHQDFEWGHHVPLARDAGLADDIIAAIRNGAGEIPGPSDVRAVWQLVRELETSRAVSDSTFEAAMRAVGDTGVVETIATVGYYTTLAMMMNAAQTPVPDDYERLP